jgi:hypothetical protein
LAEKLVASLVVSKDHHLAVRLELLLAFVWGVQKERKTVELMACLWAAQSDLMTVKHLAKKMVLQRVDLLADKLVEWMDEKLAELLGKKSVVERVCLWVVELE